MQETVTTEERINPDGTKTVVTKTVRKTPRMTPATINGGTRDASTTEANFDGSPRDGGTQSGAPGQAFCCVPILCTIL